MTKTASVVIRMNGETDSIFVDGREFDRSTMTKEERGTVRRIVRNWLFPREDHK